MYLIPLPAFQDNYLWVLHDGGRALVVDPGDAQPVLACLQRDRLQLEAILVTHHHPDHIGGVAALRDATGAAVYGPARERIPEPVRRVVDGDVIELLGLEFETLEVPGHTAGHVAYYCAAVDGAPLLFCGDALFSAGCGRVFEGTPAQMQSSLERLAALPPDTRICCSHEYTLANVRFARAVEPASLKLIHYQKHCEELRARGLPTLPSTMVQEREINPFLRIRVPAVKQAASAHDGAALADDVAVFAALRQWKNEFK